MRYNLVKNSTDMYSFSVWDSLGNLLFLYSGSKRKLINKAKEFDLELSKESFVNL
tara:strand:+ start:3898 stop:4062 length:165 start_codon:yes stop_codon:yes gene_type:complete